MVLSRTTFTPTFNLSVDASCNSTDCMSSGSGGVYGEITPYGFRDVASWMKLHEDDVFIDMGSGVGKSVCAEPPPNAFALESPDHRSRLASQHHLS
eukprot:2799052-Rhodomonas_salina.3